MQVIKQDCPCCQGEGFIIHLDPRFSKYNLAFEPEEAYQTCEHCQGEGWLEVCPYCKEPFSIREGQEICRCDVQLLPKAA